MMYITNGSLGAVINLISYAKIYVTNYVYEFQIKIFYY